MADISIKALFDLTHTAAADYLRKFVYPWEALDGISEFILSLGASLDSSEYECRDGNIWIHKTAKIFPSAYIKGPCIIGEGTEVRHCAFIRGSALIGNNCVIGNSTELKNVIIFDNVQVPHYNYVGDSILGYKSHMGAGSITSNIKSDRLPIFVNNEGVHIKTDRKKIGAMLGDFVEVGCNSVLNPGTIICKNCSIYPTSCVRGVIPEDHIYKDKEKIVCREKYEV